MSDRDKIVAAIFAQADAKREMYEENERLRAENEKLRAALKPFATVASHGYYGGPLVQARIYYECETEERAGKTYIDSAAFRAAAAALKETDND